MLQCTAIALNIGKFRSRRFTSNGYTPLERLLYRSRLATCVGPERQSNLVVHNLGDLRVSS